jgi:sialate O-acetylesterase
MTKTRLSLPSFVSDGMIIQQNQPFILRGEAYASASISISLTKRPADSSRPVSPLDPDFGILFETKITADESGSFQVELPAFAASFDPLSLCVMSDKTKIDVTDILAGEVWLAIGADNMAFPVRATANSRQMVEQANTPYVRFFYPDPSIRSAIPLEPASDMIGGKWIYGDDQEAIAQRSAIAFTFARELCQELHSPVAIIDLAIRGARLHALLPRNLVSENARLRAHVESLNYYRDESNWNLLGDLNMHQPGALYNSRIAPLRGLSVQGVLWLHGESDYDQATLYADGFCNLYEELHRILRPASSDQLTIIYGQLPPFFTGHEKDRYLARFNEMLASLRQNLPGPSGLITVYDLPPDYQNAPVPFNDPKTPWTKQPIGHRMKQSACSLVYQRKALDSAPECAEYEVVGSKLLISFSHIGDGLRLTGEDNRLRGFAICGRDRIFVEASARLLYGVRVLVWNEQISEPLLMRIRISVTRLTLSAEMACRSCRSARIASFPVLSIIWNGLIANISGLGQFATKTRKMNLHIFRSMN